MRIRDLVLVLLFVSNAQLDAAAPPASISPTKVIATTGTFDPASATRAWLDTVPADKRARSDAYFEGGYWLILWNFLIGAVLLLLALTTGISGKWRDWAEKITGSRVLQVVIYSLIFTLAALILGFPLELYQNFFREHAYQLSTQSFGSWMGDELKGALLELIANTIVFS